MSDENIQFSVQDSGTTAAFTSLLDELGKVGERAFNDLTESAGRFEQGSAAAQAAQQLMNQYIAAGGTEIAKFGQVLQSMKSTQVELAAETNSFTTAIQNLGVAEQASIVRMGQANEAYNQQSAAIKLTDEQAKVASEDITRLSTATAQSTVTAGQYATAHNNAATATGKGATAATSATAGYKSLQGVISTVTGYFGAYQAAIKVVADIDVVDSVTQQLQAVVGAGKNVDGVFNSLAQTAIATQQPLETVAKNFATIYSGIKLNGGTIQQAETEVNALARAFFLTGTPAAAASRAMHDFGEAAATGSLSGRQLTSALMQTPQTIELISEALGINIEKLTSHALAEQAAQQRLDNFTASQGQNTQSVKAATTEYDNAGKKIDALNVKGQTQQTSLTVLTAKYGENAAQVVKLEAAIEKNVTARNKEIQSYNADGVAVQSAQAKQDAYNKAKQTALQQALKNIEGLDQETIQAALSGQKFQQLLDGLSTTASGTITGAFTSLNDQFEVFLKNTNSASEVTKLVTSGLSVLGSNLNIIIPIIGFFGAAWVAVKLVNIANDLRLLATSMTLLLTETAPVTIAIGVLAVAAALLFAKTDAGKAVLQTLGDAFNKLTGVTQQQSAAQDELTQKQGVATTSTGQVATSVLNLTTEQLNQLSQQRALGASNDTLNASAKKMIEANQDNGTALDANNDKLKQQAKATTDSSTALDAAAKSSHTWASQSTTDVAQVVTSYKQVGASITGSIDPALTQSGAQTASWAQGIESNLDAIIAKAQAAAQALAAVGPAGGGGGSAGGAGGTGASRDGSSFTVPGSGGVDSQFIRVSPGEHVTVQTPMQRKSGSVNNVLPKFRDGGQIMLDNTLAAFTPGTGSITGYAPVSPTSYYTNAGSTAGVSNDLLQANAAAANDNTSAMNNLTNVIAGPGGVATSGPAAGNSLPSGSSSDPSSGGGASAYGSNSGYLGGSYTGGIMGGTGGGTSTGGGGTSTGENVPATSAQVAAKAKQIAEDTDALTKAQVVTSIAGQSKPTGITETPAQFAVWQYQGNGNYLPRPGIDPRTFQYAGDRVAAAKTLQDDMAKDARNFRDGGDFIVPGASGVDSRTIQLAVSPGETVGVRTPQQKQADSQAASPAGRGLSSPTVIFNVQTDDANSFNKSKAQIASQLKRQLSKVA